MATRGKSRAKMAEEIYEKRMEDKRSRMRIIILIL